DIYKAELEERAKNISYTMGSYIEENSEVTERRGHMGSGMGMGMFETYLAMAGDIAGTDVWIVDRDLNLITGGPRRGHQSLMPNVEYSDLPKNADILVQKVFEGETAFSEEFSNLLSESTLTVGAPILSSSGEILGVTLMHSAIEGANESISRGIMILIVSILIALGLSLIVASILSRTFTKPLLSMNKTALRLSEGDYKVKTRINEKDEIGELAKTLDVLANRLDKASKESEKLDLMRKEFLANISHELKAPVTVMRGSLEALVDEIITDPEKIKDYHVQMLSESKFLERLVNDLLDLSRLQSLDFKIEKTKISLCDVIDDAVRSARSIAKDRNIEIVASKDTSFCSFNGDYGRLRQMIMIILDNAVKFSPENEKVFVDFEKGKLTIKDNGEGIEKSALPYIFDRFYKSKYENNKKGTGLGLSISKQIAARHGMNLKAESTLGEGTSFIFSW
ncbi:MAG: HAMP domain-containing histidine kinase, partial [Clostridium sp.]|nr:HAMP domain-containing histidine kinase [Clostridium sp.]